MLAGGSRAAHWRQRRALQGACDEVRRTVRAALDPGADSATLNATAEAAWKRYEATRERELSPEQLARLAVGIEFPGQHHR